MNDSTVSQTPVLAHERGGERLILTGATGLLGEYLIRDLTARGVGLAVLARGSRQFSAKQRIETICRRWERLAGRALPRPVVLEGHLDDSFLGLSTDAKQWVANNCNAVLHNAASLQFVAEEGIHGEPWRSNLAGTQHVLDFAQSCGLRDFFQVSTAYVCGTRTGTIHESETDVGQSFGNDYEASKCAAEVAVQQRRGQFRSATFFRPAIITGDYLSGYTSTFHGLYAPLKIVASLLGRASVAGNGPKFSALQALGVSHNDMKNFVPVDWVSGVIARVITDPRGYGQTYHLTADQRTPCDLMAAVMHEVLSEHFAQQRDGQQKASVQVGNAMDTESISRTFRDQMEIYRAYWRNDPVFDRSNSQRLLPDYPPPTIDRISLRRLCRYALRNNFGWPRPNVRPPERWSDEILSATFASGPSSSLGEPSQSPYSSPSDLASSEIINLRVLGEGGGDFHLSDPRAVVRVDSGAANRCRFVYGFSSVACGELTLSSETLENLLTEKTTLRGEISCGRVICQMSGSDLAVDWGGEFPQWVLAMERTLGKVPVVVHDDPTPIPKRSK
jgi:thioester reductase-like protein